MVAVLEDAARCLARQPQTGRFHDLLVRWEAEQWVKSDDAEPLFSFARICSHFDLDAGSLRKRLLRWSARPRPSMRIA